VTFIPKSWAIIAIRIWMVIIELFNLDIIAP
jgi:hypothetical protein